MTTRIRTAVWVSCGLAIVLCGCTALQGPSRTSTAPPVSSVTETLDVDGQTVTATKLLLPNGPPYAFVFRAAAGLVVCPHFDLEGLARGGVPAARSHNWKLHGFREQLNETIDAVNAPAKARGITVGMTVRRALGRLAKDKNSDRRESLFPTGCAPCACRRIREDKQP